MLEYKHITIVRDFSCNMVGWEEARAWLLDEEQSSTLICIKSDKEVNIVAPNLFASTSG
jgi:hypothetical protein